MCAATAIRQGPSTKVIISACPDSLDPDMRCHTMPRDATRCQLNGACHDGTSVESEYGPEDARIRGIRSNESAFFRVTLKDRGRVRGKEREKWRNTLRDRERRNERRD
ncbi:unnamed protein product [Lasius platythorax]|uniref:Uncharacterized protein n=1 Tax=Lasius platythorax TaxID=488582 RepID=A0AAV2N580_9HYME